jgi:hypothetical protein
MISALVRTALIILAVTTLSFPQALSRTNLYPSTAKPRKSTVSLTSAEHRTGKVVYQVFYLRDDPKREAFRVEIGSYDKEQLVKDWSYGIILDKDLNGDGVPDYVWYGGDDTGQRLLWFLSKEKKYGCINVFKTAEAAWKEKFGRAAPDLGEVGGNDLVDDAIWDGQTLTVTVLVDTWEQSKTHKVKLIIDPAAFVKGER